MMKVKPDRMTVSNEKKSFIRNLNIVVITAPIHFIKWNWFDFGRMSFQFIAATSLTASWTHSQVILLSFCLLQGWTNELRIEEKMRENCAKSKWKTISNKMFKNFCLYLPDHHSSYIHHEFATLILVQHMPSACQFQNVEKLDYHRLDFVVLPGHFWISKTLLQPAYHWLMFQAN